MRSADPTFDDSVNKQTGKSRTNPAIVHVPGSIALQDFAVTSVPQQQHLLHDAASTTHHVSDHEKVSSPLEVAARKRPRMLHHPSSIAGRASFIDKDEPVPTAVTPPATPPSPPSSQCLAKAGPVSWSDLPSKRQLCILTMARLSEPLTQTSLQAYMFYQLKYFNPSLSSSTISAQAGMLQASFTAAQFVTAILWGRMADADWGGRKRVLLIGLFGTAVSCVGFGFSRSFWQAMVCRTLGGALNGNIGVMRTMISEIIKEKRYVVHAY